jgi:hypothetical protein
MKKEVVVAIAAGVAVTGLAIFLFATDKGKKFRKNVKVKGLTASATIADLIKAGKEKLESVKEDMLKECDSREVVA